jgi:hypothetical protein
LTVLTFFQVNHANCGFERFDPMFLKIQRLFVPSLVKLWRSVQKWMPSLTFFVFFKFWRG